MRVEDLKSKLSEPLLVTFMISIVGFLLSSYLGSLMSTSIFILIGIMLYKKITTDQTYSKNKRRNSDSEKSKFDYERLQNENYRLVRELEKKTERLSPLKSDNENKQSQIQRQTLQIEQLCHELELVQKKKSRLMEEIENVKMNKNKECEMLEGKLKEFESRMSELENLNFEKQMENDVYRRDYDEMAKKLSLAIDERNLMEHYCREEMAKIQIDRKKFCDFETEARRYVADRESELSIYKKMCQNYEEKIAELQISKTYLENSRKELQKFHEMKRAKDVEIEQLKSRLESTEKETEVPLCNICEDNERNTYLHPCGHTLCSVCARRVMSANNKCPVCRHRIHQTGPLFLS